MYRDFTYIVTDCTGYVGNVLTKKLMADGCRVIGFARSREKAERVFGGEKPELVFGDIACKEDVERLFEIAAPTCVVIHTAAEATIGEGSKGELYAATVTGTQYVVDAYLSLIAEGMARI